MSETSGTPSEPNRVRIKEYEDPHYHDEDEVAPVTDDDAQNLRKPNVKSRKSAPRRPIIRRHFEE